MERRKHLRVSVATRNAAVITAVNNGATSAALAAEYEVKWGTIRDSIRNDHYCVSTRPANMSRYREFLAKVKANDASAAVTADHSASSSKPQARTIKEDTDKSALSPVTHLTAHGSTDNASANKPNIFLVETGILLHWGVDQLLALNEGENVYWIPRFCIDELRHMAGSTRLANDPVKDKAKSSLLKIYADGVWKTRFIPFEPVEQGLITKTPDVAKYKTRSFGVAEAALELYIDSNARVNVLTTSMEIQHLVTRAAKAEDLSNEITVTRVYTK